MLKNYSFEETPTTSMAWTNKSISSRINLINGFLKKNNLDKDFLAISAAENGQVVLKVFRTLPVNIRSLLLLDLEKKIKSSIDKGITLWCESIGDRSTLRNLRGIKIKL